MPQQMHLGSIPVDVVRKDIKNVHLSVHPPTGRVSIAAPSRMSLETVRVFALSKLSWIKKQQRTMLQQDRETPREYLDRESHYAWGKRYLLRVVEQEASPRIELKHARMQLHVRPGSSPDKMRAVMEAWYRDQLRQAIPPLIAKWEPIMGVKVARFFVQRMKTQWGSCSVSNNAIRLNTELAKKPPECLEYIVVHEMAHLLVPSHDAQFIALMDRIMPRWSFYRDVLNRLPVQHENWKY